MRDVSGVNSSDSVQTHQSAAAPDSAADLIGAATNSRTGSIDTRQLASWVADAAKHDFGTASKAYEQIDAQLSRQDPAAAGHFSRDVAHAFAHTSYTGPVWGAGKGISEAGKLVLRSNPILQVRWASTPNVAGEHGFTAGLAELLKSKGIETAEYPRLNSLNPSNDPKYRTANGAAARDAIAADYKAHQFTVRTEITEQTPLKTAKFPTGERHVDVIATRTGRTPETGIRVDVESKLGRPSLDADTRLQVAKDAFRLERNANLRGLGNALEVGGKILKPVGVAVDAVQIGVAIKEDGGQFGPHAQRTTAEVAGGAAGGWAGAETGAAAGAAIGTFIAPGIGTAIGGVIGGLLGGFGGGWLGSKAGDAAYDAAAHR
ncbi:MAG TPA: hypothetical protein VGI32_10705 [Steroidobacteraceae bacterium]